MKKVSDKIVTNARRNVSRWLCDWCKSLINNVMWWAC